VTKVDKDLPVSDIASMPDILNASVAQPRFRTFLLGLFATSRETLILISAGLILGGISALGASRILGHLLFGVSAS
jgi:hypothetical protein